MEIGCRDFWFKMVDSLEHNWALIDDDGVRAVTDYFLGDELGVLDRMSFESFKEAGVDLVRNGFARLAEDHIVQDFISAPLPPFHKSFHPNGPIHSSGRF